MQGKKRSITCLKDFGLLDLFIGALISHNGHWTSIPCPSPPILHNLRAS